MSNFDINNFEKVESIQIFKPSDEVVKRYKDEYKKLPLKIIANPWEFWMTVLGSTSLVSFICYLIIFIIIYFIFKKNDFTNAIIYVLLFLLWIGPIIIFTPLILVFAVSNTLSGNFATPIGCGPRIENGVYVDCM